MRYTYLIHNGRNYKIGYSKNPEMRLKTFKVADPNCKLIIFGAGNIEKELHLMYKKHRIKGEWFDLNRIEIQKIKEYIEKGEILIYKPTEDEDMLNQYIGLSQITKKINSGMGTLSKEAKIQWRLLKKINSDYEKYPESNKYIDNEIASMPMSF